MLVSLLLLLALLGRVGLALVGPEYGAAAPQAGLLAASGGVAADLSVLRQLHLFARVETGLDATAAASLAPGPLLHQSALDLRLEGVMLGSSPAASRAVISHGTLQRSYRTGEALAGNARVLLQEVARDHVVIDNQGTREVLALRSDTERSASTGIVAASSAAAGAWSASLPAIDSAAASAALAELMQVSPAQANGSLIGLRLEPGKRLKDFVQLGFRTGDVVTAVNGIPMTELSRLPELYGLLQGSAAVSFSLLREGQPLTLDISLPAPLAAAGN